MAKTASTKDKAGRDGLTDKERRFVQEYPVDWNATKSAMRAGYSPKTAHVTGHHLLRKPKIAELIEKRRVALAKKADITVEKVLRRWWELANADVNELVQYQHVNCRHCYGRGHAFQWIDEEEFARACISAEAKAEDGKPVMSPSDAGGYGFNPTFSPNPECPKCFGEGNERMFIADTRSLSPSATALYDGIKQTKEGIEVKMRDRDKALENVARHLGMLKGNLSLDVPEGSNLSGLLEALGGSTLEPDPDPDES